MTSVEEQVQGIEKIVAIHIFVELSQTDHRKVDFETDWVTGAQIKAAADAPMEDDLGYRSKGQIEYVPDDQEIQIKNGDHFVVLPAGTIS